MWGNLTSQETNFHFLSMPGRTSQLCIYTYKEFKSKSLEMTAPNNHLKGISRSVFHPLAQIRHWLDPRHQFILCPSGISAWTWHLPYPGLQAQVQRPKTPLVFVQTPSPVPGEESSNCPAHLVQLLPPLPFWEVYKGICNTHSCTHPNT